MRNPQGRGRDREETRMLQVLQRYLICVMLRQMVKKERNQRSPGNTNQKTLRLIGFIQNEDDEWVKKAVATPSQEIQEEAAEEEEAEKEDPEEVEPVTEDRADEEITVPASPRTPHTPAVGRSAAFGSHATRLALLEASISDLKEQTVMMHCDIWAGFDEIKSILASHTTNMEIITYKAYSTQQHYNNLITMYKTILYDWRQSFITKMTELTTTWNHMTDLVSRTASNVTQTFDIFINKDTDLRPEVESWVKWFSHSYTTFLRKYRIDPGHCPV
ncbi:hypothetical protein CJ030_MR8G012630 [Morella rubra]|uniref:Uncharacterized protein n=1 Tax=Morella rubra TaxID=262757 RepID=A0A6A1US87_9ROSI|nr:hypothetical protein CJ030_MR8G012630 [Morella rubra]